MSYFPGRSYSDAGEFLDEYASAVDAAFATIDRQEIRKAAAVLQDAVERRSTIFVCGNGGSAAISNHFVCDHVKGVRAGTDSQPRVASLSSNIEIVTAVANDIGYEAIFEFQLESLGAAGDVLVVVSSSGNSPNIINALNWARRNDTISIAMTGFDGGDARALADITLHVEARNYGIVEDVHQSLMHILAQFLRQKNLRDQRELGNVKF